jgi:hypothetical protein
MSGLPWKPAWREVTLIKHKIKNDESIGIATGDHGLCAGGL